MPLTPVPFTGQTAVAAKGQPQYQDLPVHISTDGVVTACWRGDLFDRIIFLFTGRIWVQLFCFGDPITPSIVSSERPDLERDSSGGQT